MDITHTLCPSTSRDSFIARNLNDYTLQFMLVAEILFTAYLVTKSDFFDLNKKSYKRSSHLVLLLLQLQKSSLKKAAETQLKGVMLKHAISNLS